MTYQGRIYDTDTAEIIYESLGGPGGMPDEALCRTPEGAWFVHSHGWPNEDGIGEKEIIKPLTDVEARDWLKSHATREYFDRMKQVLFVI
jgi:hypothetical protein